MAPGLQESVTIINNSGKIISTGKQLFGIFKEAKASYKEKKAVLNHERSLQRAQTFDAAYLAPEPEFDNYDYGHNPPYGPSDTRSNASGRSRRSERPRYRPALTEANLRSHSEVSATSPSAAPPAYRSPYAETSQELARSRPSLARAPTEGVLYEYEPPPPFPMQRAASDPSMKVKKKKEPDMDLAYGNVPPDLASRTDLDPYSSPDAKEAKTLIGRVEGLLEEAQCVQHSAGATISHLQRNPDAAAAVALTLAELSGVLAKMSPSFLGVLKGGSPAVFALLASPQFLIAAGAAVGVTVVMFGGWKIIKRMKEQKARREESMAFAAAMGNMPPQDMPQGIPMQAYPPQGAPMHGYPDQARGGPGTVYYEEDPEEALVIEEELSGIESWRRGISPFGENGEADMELISPEAQRAVRREKREQRRRRRSMDDDEPTPDDSISMAGRSERSHRSHRSSRHSRRDDERSHYSRRDDERSSYSRRDDERSRYSRRDDESEFSRRSGRSRRTMKTIEEGRSENELEVVLRGPKEKKGNMLKSLFKKKKDKEDMRAMSVMV